MKLLLTSAGLTNKILQNEFIKLVGKNPKDISVAFIITASLVEDNQEFVREDLNNLKKTGVEKIKEIDISKEKEIWHPIIKESDVVWIEGGNTYYLLDWIRKTGLDRKISELLKDKVYVGVSAGSIITGPDISIAAWDVGVKDINLVGLNDYTGLNLVPFEIFPHFKKEKDEEDLRKLANQVNYPVYALDNESAVLVINDKFSIIGKGVGLKIN